MATRKRDMVRGLTAEDCMAALRGKYKPPGDVLFEQVANGTGWKAGRFADAVAMGIWPSRGMEIHGFEIKVDRGDWKRELENPAKSDEIQSYCDRWFIVAPRGLIDLHEMPPTWGLMEVSESKSLLYTLPAPQLEAKALTRHFVAAILRRQSEVIEDLLRAARREGKEEGAANGAGELAEKLASVLAQHEKLNEAVSGFEDASGLSVRFGWPHGKELGQAVKLVTDRRFRRDAVDDLRRSAESLRHTADFAEKEAKALEKVRVIDLGEKASAAE